MTDVKSRHFSAKTYFSMIQKLLKGAAQRPGILLFHVDKFSLSKDNYIVNQQ